YCLYIVCHSTFPTPRLFCFTPPAPTQIYTLSLHDALPISRIAASSSGRSERMSTTSHDTSTMSCRSARRESRAREATSRCSPTRSEEHTSELQSPYDLVCRLLLEKKKQRRS